MFDSYEDWKREELRRAQEARQAQKPKPPTETIDPTQIPLPSTPSAAPAAYPERTHRKPLLEDPVVPEPMEEPQRDTMFSPESPDTKLEPPSSPTPAKEDEEEGEIVDDDDGGDEVCQTASSSEYSPSSASQSPHTSGSPIKRSSSNHHNGKRPSSRTEVIIPQKRKRRANDNSDSRGDRDYRRSDSNGDTIAVPHTNRHNDTDYRYQVYIPRSAEAVSVPVRVINYDRDSESHHRRRRDSGPSRAHPVSSSSSSPEHGSQMSSPGASPRGRHHGGGAMHPGMMMEGPGGYMPGPQMIPMAHFPMAVSRPTMVHGFYLPQATQSSGRPMIGMPTMIGYHPYGRVATMVPAFIAPMMHHPQAGGHSMHPPIPGGHGWGPDNDHEGGSRGSCDQGRGGSSGGSSNV